MKVRKSNFELLRILAIAFILMHHFYLNNYNFDYANITLNQFIVQYLSTLGKVGVNIFVIITRYFMIDSKCSISKVLKIIGEIIFYSWSLLILYYMFCSKDLGIKVLIKCLLPISYKQYWFMTAYIVLYIFADYINIFINNLNKKEFEKIIFLIFIIGVILPTTINSTFVFSDFGWFLFLYMLGAYHKKYSIKIENKKACVLLIILLIIDAISIFILDKMYNVLLLNPLHFSISMNQVVSIGIALNLFIIFEKFDIGEIKLINKISSTTLGIYMIHCHILIRDVIWYNIYDVLKFEKSKYIVIYEVFVIITLFASCVIIDLCRQNTIEKLYLNICEKVMKKITSNNNKIKIKQGEIND